MHMTLVWLSRCISAECSIIFENSLRQSFGLSPFGRLFTAEEEKLGRQSDKASSRLGTDFILTFSTVLFTLFLREKRVLGVFHLIDIN